MKDSCSPHITELRAQLSYAPAAVRAQHLRRLEGLICELDPEREYPYSYLFFRITAFDPDDPQETLFQGAELVEELTIMLGELSKEIDEHAKDQAEKILTINDAADKCNVSVRTILRWKKLGLPLRWFRFSDGRSRLGIRKPLLDVFATTNSERVTRSAGFSRMSESERREIVSHARKIREATNEGISAVSELVSEKTGRSPESIRAIIRHHDKRNPTGRIFPSPSEHMSDEEREKMVELFERGIPITDLCARYGRSRSAIYAAVRAHRCARITSENIRFVENPDFAASGAEKRILGPNGIDEPLDIEPQPAVESGEDPFSSQVSSIPVLSRERERDLFRKYNYLKYRMSAIQNNIREHGYRAAEVKKFDKLKEKAGEIRQFLIRSNLRLVAGIARRHTGPVVGFSDLVSMGTIALMRSVESFDFARGFKFSTYASWAITKEYARKVPEENFRILPSISDHEEFIEAPETLSDEERRRSEAVAHLRFVLKRAFGNLNEMEQEVIRQRFGLESKKALTLDEVGSRHGLTGERIRQIQNGALDKLRRIISPDILETLPG